jgi:hypothetical protein
MSALRVRGLFALILGLLFASCMSYGAATPPPPAPSPQTAPAPAPAPMAGNSGCDRTITARVVAIDQPFLVNRLGAAMPEGMVFALERDVVPKSGTGTTLTHGNVMLRAGKRPRPIVLRANVGDCLAITFRNLLSDTAVSTQPATRYASVHVAGMQMVNTILDDGSFVASNANSTIPPDDTKYITYVLRATEEGTFLLNSEGAAFGGNNQPNDGAQVTAGLFGAVNVQPRSAEWYRSQVTHSDLEFAIDTTRSGGFSSIGQPFINYDAVYPPGNPMAGIPVLAMLDNRNEIVHTDLTAVITGPHHGRFPAGTNDPNLQKINIEPNRLDPYREFTIEYHELNDAVQAFPIFGAPAGIANTLGAAGDAFAINYGTGGIGAEILANRFGVGPMGSCPDCRFEEFFLSAWSSGDPAMLVDVPANVPCSGFNNQTAVTITGVPSVPCTEGVAGNAPKDVVPVRKATKALYDDDPSNVYHSYINDRVKFRILHSGTGVSHVHHLHAHQWVHSPNSDGSTYLDSQLINPGSAYTLEIAFNGGGNRNKVVGDSIFHCHFYPHFAAGMWALWRSHDVYEVGSPYASTGFDKLARYKTRALPDGEIATGTPIPALIPMPSIAMPPMPAAVKLVEVNDPNGTPGVKPVGYKAEVDAGDMNKGINPGFPFFIPGVAGVRAPHPPLDFATDGAGKTYDGGLPRHLIINANIFNEQHTTLNFSKDMDKVNAYELPEDGTAEEKVAMAYHEKCFHPSFTPEGTSSPYRTNGLPRASGAPYANPGLVPYDENDPPIGDAQCKPITNWIKYKAAVMQTDFVFNKKGWHYPQARLLTLWRDVLPTAYSDVPPQPFFIRANAGQGVEFWHTDLVPNYFLLDDYEVRTPTDIIGQHIHLVKFDVTSSDGAANGYNYEDGTLSYEEVQDLLKGINQCGGLALTASDLKKCNTNNAKRVKRNPVAPPKEICDSTDPARTKHCKEEWAGAQTTVQRWLADPIPHENINGTRTLRTVFTHDHFGPSTHQQTGLYAALLVEPTGSSWSQGETGAPLGKRDDGGPTTWNAVIETPGQEKNTYREFALAMQDFQFAYRATSRQKASDDPNVGWSDPSNAIDPVPQQTDLGEMPQPQIISAGPTQGTTSFNYRNEPLPYRVAPGASNDTKATDLSYVFASNIQRNDSQMNSQPPLGGDINPAKPGGFIWPRKALTEGMQPGDPYTPLLRAYEGDRVQVRIVAGAHMLPHAFTVGGMKWLFEPSWDESGWRSSQSMGISEHFEFLFETPRASPSTDAAHNWSDYLYQPDASNQKHGIVDGTWGIFRAYKSKMSNLVELTTNRNVTALPPATAEWGYSCPPVAASQVKRFRVVSSTPAPFNMNSRGAGAGGRFNNTITNNEPMMFTLFDNTSTTEPLIMRANAGDCIALTIVNSFNPNATQFTNGGSTAAFAPTIPLLPSKQAGLTPALLSFDAMRSTGLNVGFNPDQTVPIGGEKTLYWYAGQTNITSNGTVTGTPRELGGANLTPSDPLEQDLHGLVGGLVVEPANTIACPDVFNPRNNMPQYGSATIYRGGDCTNPSGLLYREFVLLTQEDLASVAWPGATWTPPGGTTVTSAPGSTRVAVNFRTEPMAYRFNAATSTFVTNPNIWQGYSDGLVLGEPQTPIFAAAGGTPARMRLLHPGGSGDQQVLTLHGHVWQELPYTGTGVNASAFIGDNRNSQYLGARDNFGTNMSYEINLPSAGGGDLSKNVWPVAGDYIWRTTPANFLELGLWGIMRVTEKSGSDAVRIAGSQFSNGELTVFGSTTVYVDRAANPKNGNRAATVSLFLSQPGQPGDGTQLSADVKVGENGLWSFSTTNSGITTNDPRTVTAISPNGGVARHAVENVILLGQPQTPQPEVQGESGRFVSSPRQHEGEETPKDETAPRKLTAPKPIEQGKKPVTTPPAH